MKKCFLFFIISTLITSCKSPKKYDLVIENIGFFDGEKDYGKVNLAIDADTIALIALEDIKGDSVINGTGKYIIPGLVNAHVHASSEEHLKTGYPLGILYLLNMHTGLEDREKDWKELTKDSLGYSVLYGSGHAATVPGGHPTQFSPNMETINDSTNIEDWVDHRIANGADYIKLIHVTRGFMGEPTPPSLNYKQIGGLIKYSHQRGYKVVIHATGIDEMVEIAKYKPDGFVHMLDYKDEYPVPEGYFKEIEKSGAFIVPTGGISLKPMDGLPPFIIEWVTENVLNAEERAEIIRKYQEYDIPIVAGTDAQEGQMDFGADYFLELELYKRAGFSNLEVLRTTTGNAAKAFNLPIGEIRVGSQATFLLLNENPLNDLSNLKTLEQVWKNGKTQ